MNVLLISQCDKRALTETRRILDQFAERRGDRTWQTPITQEGLDTLHRLLRKTARKNTAVACHWIRGLDHSELLWVVGNERRFNTRGAVPTNTTSRDVLRRESENDWLHGEAIHLLVALAALIHDLGKSSRAFQWRLQGRLVERNQYRHEWASLRLFESFVGADSDAQWLDRLAEDGKSDATRWLEGVKADGFGTAFPSPFVGLAHAPLAQAIGWLVVTHHRLPIFPLRGTDERPSAAHFRQTLWHLSSAWNEVPTQQDPSIVQPYWDFPWGLPVAHQAWRDRASRVAKRLLTMQAQPGEGGWLANPYVMHISRLVLMLADHHYSSLEGDAPERVKITAPGPLLANTRRDGAPNQTLDEHLVGVARVGAELAHFLPRFERHLPRLTSSRFLRQRASNERFRWQDRAADLAGGLRERSRRDGAFIVNMASTGCGKTLANARVMYALSEPQDGMRCAFAMGLRTLTLQTGRAFRDLLHLGDDDLAIRVGGAATRELFEHFEAEAEATGSASRQALLDEHGSSVVYEGQHAEHPLLRRAFADAQVRALLAAPVLVCTIDHLTPATESQRGGRQIAPMLRLMSGDLVLDEPDDFDIDDLPALTRLVHWAGLLGSRVLLSSATLPPALVQGLFEAYRTGRGHHLRSRGDGATRDQPRVCCVWLDEHAQRAVDCDSQEAFAVAHESFVVQRAARLATMSPRRKVELVALTGLPNDLERQAEGFARQILPSALSLHRAHHGIDPVGGGRVSFGLVRMANVEPLVAVARALFRLGAPPGWRIHLCVYHSQFPLLLRSAIERRLDATLDRRQPEAVFSLPDVRLALDGHPDPDQIFIVLGSPVVEVGRDHDYDWALVEPSSMRSLIQLAGRVRRHRIGVCSVPNVHVFTHNLRHFRHPGQPAFQRPGFETPSEALASHDLRDLLRPDEYESIDARPRIFARPSDLLKPRTSWVDLEHVRMRSMMLPAVREGTAAVATGRRRGSTLQASFAVNAAAWWNLPPADALTTGLLPQCTPFRKDDISHVDLVLLPDEGDEDYVLTMLLETRRGHQRQVLRQSVEASMNHRIPDSEVTGQGIMPWGCVDYMASLADLARDMDMTVQHCAERFGTVTLPEHEAGWSFHPALGFTKRRFEGRGVS